MQCEKFQSQHQVECINSSFNKGKAYVGPNSRTSQTISGAESSDPLQRRAENKQAGFSQNEANQDNIRASHTSSKAKLPESRTATSPHLFGPTENQKGRQPLGELNGRSPTLVRGNTKQTFLPPDANKENLSPLPPTEDTSAVLNINELLAKCAAPTKIRHDIDKPAEESA